jgi:hypothetical protein
MKKMKSHGKANTDQRAHEGIDTEITKRKTLGEHRAAILFSIKVIKPEPRGQG